MVSILQIACTSHENKKACDDDEKLIKICCFFPNLMKAGNSRFSIFTFSGNLNQAGKGERASQKRKRKKEKEKKKRVKERKEKGRQREKELHTNTAVSKFIFKMFCSVLQLRSIMAAFFFSCCIACSYNKVQVRQQLFSFFLKTMG